MQKREHTAGEHFDQRLFEYYENIPVSVHLTSNTEPLAVARSTSSQALT